MSDDLKNSLKELETYVEHEKKEKAKEAKKFERDLKYSALRGQWTFPLNKLLFLSFCLSASVGYFGDYITPLIVKYAPREISTPIVELKLKTLQAVQAAESFRAQKTMGDPQRLTASDSSNGADRAASGDPATGGDAGTGAAQASESGGTASHASSGSVKSGPSQPEWVQIDRKWYKKTPDNIYLVNGKKMLYIENRMRTPTAASGTPTPPSE